MKRKLNAIDWKELFHGKDVNLSWKTFLKLLNDVILKYTPRFTFNNKRKKSIWMNSQTFWKVQLKNRAYHQYLRATDHNDYNIYVKYRNQAKRACRKAVSDYEYSLSKEVKSNPKAFFAYAKSKLKYASSIPDLKDGSKIITSDEGKATLFNSFFKSVFTKEKSTLPDFEPVCEANISEVVFSEERVKKKLLNLNPYKSPEADNLHPRILKDLSVSLSLPLSILYSESFKQQKLPQDWKDAMITPLYKKDKKCLASNYRPIGLTSIICKIMKSIKKDDSMSYACNNSIITSLEHGFLPGRSCQPNLLIMLNCLTEAIDREMITDVIYLDFPKAFDSVPHNRLIYKLNKYGITGNLLHWISDFLNKRRQYVRVNSALSEWESVISGVP